MRTFILIVFLFSTSPSFASIERNPASSFAPKVGQTLSVEFGSDVVDSFVFSNKKRFYEATYRDESRLKPMPAARRAMPPELAEKKILELGYLLSRLQSQDSNPRQSFCRTVIKVSKSNVKPKYFCVDNLAQADDKAFVHWVKTMRQLFLY